MCPASGKDSNGRDTDEAASDTPRRDAAAAAQRATGGFSRRDFEVIDARRVERADLVRDVLRRRRDAVNADERDERAAETGTTGQDAGPDSSPGAAVAGDREREANPVDIAKDDTREVTRLPDGSLRSAPGSEAAGADATSGGGHAVGLQEGDGDDAARDRGEAPTDDTVQLKRDAGGRIAAAKDALTHERNARHSRNRDQEADDGLDGGNAAPGSRASSGLVTRIGEVPGALTGDVPSADDTVRLSRTSLERSPGAPESGGPRTRIHQPPPAGSRSDSRQSEATAQDAASDHASADANDPNDSAPPTAAIRIPVQAARPEATATDASAAAIAILRSWRADAEQRAAGVAEAQLQARTERGRDRLDPTSELRRAVESPGGQTFLRELLDDVIRPDDHIVAGNGLGDLAERIPPTISQRARRAFRLGVFAGPGVPWVAVPALRRTARAFFGRELVRDTPETRDAAAAHAREIGAIPRARPLGDPVVGTERAAERLRRIAELIDDPAYPEVEFTIEDIEPHPNLWNLDGTVDRLAMALAPLYFAALGGPNPRSEQTHLVLRATSSLDLELAVRVFMRVLDEDALRDARAGITLPAEFPETTGLLRRLAGWAHMRCEDLGAPITVGVARSGDIQQERVDAVMNGWRLASFAEDRDVDSSVVRLLDQALQADHAAAMRVEVDGDVLRDAAFGVALAAARGGHPLRVIVPVGVGDVAVERMRAAGAEVVQRLPIVPSDSMRPAVPYLLHRVDQEAGAATAGELSESMLTGRDALHPEDERLLDAVGRMFQLPGGPNRHQERVDAEDAATVTASIQLELFPEGLLGDEPLIDGAAGANDKPVAPDARQAMRALVESDGAAGDVEGAEGTDDVDASALDADGRIPHLEDASGGEFVPPGAHERQKPAAAAPSATDQFGPLSTENPSDTGPSARLTEIVLGLRRGRFLRNTFRNAPNTDPSIAANREWSSRIQRRIGRSSLGADAANDLRVTTPEQVEALLAKAGEAGPLWGEKPGWERAAHLERVAKAIEANRARLIEVAVSEFGVPVSDADADVSRTVDIANHAAHLARQLDRMQGAAFHPVGVTVVLPPASPPVAGASGGALTSLASGSAVIVKASPKTRRTAAVLAGVLWAAELPHDLVQLAIIDEGRVAEEQLARSLITDGRVGRVILTGTTESARTLLGWRPDLPLIAGTSGKNSIIVTPAADLDQAALDVAKSAFVSTGQRAGHAGNVILVGSVARSNRFLQQLADAVTSIPFGYPSDPGALAGPLVHPADAQLRFALTQLGEGERWLVEPRQLDDTGRLWSPGVRLGVQPGSYAHVTEFFGPVLGVMHARTLGEAIKLQNATQYGLAAGLQSNDRAEIGRWIHEVQAGSLFINRDTLGNTVQRHPFGGWRRSAVGTYQKSGGPNAIMPLGEWRVDPGQQSPTLHLRGMDPKAVRLIEAAQSSLDYDAFDRVRRTALSCQIAWNEEFGEVSDVENLAFERNLFRYIPAAVTVRLAEGAPLEELIRALAGARIVRAVPDISTAIALPDAVVAILDELQFAVRVESDAEFASRVHARGLDSLRIRLLGGSRRQVATALGGDTDIAVWSDPVTFAGRVELLPFLREQSISMTSHRYGRPDRRVAELFAHEKILDPDRPFGELS